MDTWKNHGALRSSRKKTENYRNILSKQFEYSYQNNFDDGDVAQVTFAFLSSGIVLSSNLTDLTALRFFLLWGFLKSKVYVNEPNVIEQLKDAIGESITNITCETCENVTKSILRLRARLPKLFVNVILILYSIHNVQVLMNLLYRKLMIAGCSILSKSY